MQMRFATNLTDEEYVSQRAWNAVQAPGVSVVPAGPLRVGPARVLPARAAAGGLGAALHLPGGGAHGEPVAGLFRGVGERLPGGAGAGGAGGGKGRDAGGGGGAAAAPRECSPASAQRWLQRRLQRVRLLLVAVKALYPERFTGVEPTLAGFGQQLGSETVLRTLRAVAAAQLGELAAPLGFRRVRLEVRIGAPGAKKQACGLSPPPGSG